MIDWREFYCLNLSNEQAIEWLVLYSSETWKNIIQNTLLIDIDNNIIWFKYNWVDKLYADQKKVNIEYKRPLVVVKNNHPKLDEWFYIIDIHKKGYKIPFNIKYKNDFKNDFTKIFLEFIKNRDYKSLLNSLNLYQNSWLEKSF